MLSPVTHPPLLQTEREKEGEGGREGRSFKADFSDGLLVAKLHVHVVTLLEDTAIYDCTCVYLRKPTTLCKF